MRVGELTKWGVPSRIIEMWRRHYGETLLPVQAEAVCRGLLGKLDPSGRDQSVRMVISAPTSSGKSLCAEMAMVRQLMARRRTVWLLPLRALAEQHYAAFADRYESLGVRGIIVTSDHPENSSRLLRGDFQVAFVINEKFDWLLTSDLDSLAGLGLVVIDELQTVTQPGRGAVLERCLTKLLASVYEPSVLGLSAVLGSNDRGAGQLAAWLGAELVEERRRPVDLLCGVAAEGTCRLRSYNSGEDTSEPFARIDSGEEMIEAFSEELEKATEGCLVFLKSRRDTVEAAQLLVERVDWPSALDALADLESEEQSLLTDTLRRVLGRGVAFHSSDLSARQRRVVEVAFARGEVRVIFATTTLAMGIDLPARRVFLEPVKYASANYGDRPRLVPITRAEFDNMTGRAGRYRGPQSRPGRAVVLAATELDRDILWNSYLETSELGPLVSAWSSLPEIDWVLDMVVSRLACCRDDLGSLYGASLAARCSVEPEPDFGRTLDRLVEAGLVVSDADGYLSPSAAGRICGRSGLTYCQFRHIDRRLREAVPGTGLGWTALALSCPDWDLPPGFHVLANGINSGSGALTAPDQLELEEGLHFLAAEERGLMDRRARVLMRALILLQEWSHLEPLQDLERRYQVHLGQIVSMGSTTAHLLRGIAALTRCLMPGVDPSESIRARAFAVRHGLPVELAWLQRTIGGSLGRAGMAAFWRAGLVTPDSILTADSSLLQSSLQRGAAHIDMKDFIALIEQEANMESIGTATMPSVPGQESVRIAEPELIEVLGESRGERYAIRINGLAVLLTGKSFKYFTRLAWSRLHGRSGWVDKEDLEAGFNQARYLYRMKGEINSALVTSWPIVENNRLGGYRLKVEPGKIRIDSEALRRHPDYEVRCLADEPGQSGQPQVH